MMHAFVRMTKLFIFDMFTEFDGIQEPILNLLLMGVFIKGSIRRRRFTLREGRFN